PSSRVEARRWAGQWLPSVSALSGVVANGHQTVHSVSSTPSKIPYGGFSPVRLQTGLQGATFVRPIGADLWAPPVLVRCPPIWLVRLFGLASHPDMPDTGSDTLVQWPLAPARVLDGMAHPLLLKPIRGWGEINNCQHSPSQQSRTLRQCARYRVRHHWSWRKGHPHQYIAPCYRTEPRSARPEPVKTYDGYKPCNHSGNPQQADDQLANLRRNTALRLPVVKKRLRQQPRVKKTGDCAGEQCDHAKRQENSKLFFGDRFHRDARMPSNNKDTTNGLMLEWPN
ncbi:MAG: hypothetical protein JWR26_4452, partial [Pedosphaera sp.]|nr:hypothetical protein [Pedosphaera sp.]